MYENSPFILCLCFCSYRWSPSPVFHAHSTQNLKGIWEQSVFFHICTFSNINKYNNMKKNSFCVKLIVELRLTQSAVCYKTSLNLFCDNAGEVC